MLTKFGISRRIFIEAPHIKFHLNPASGGRAETCARTEGQLDRERERQNDGPDETYERFSQKAPNKAKLSRACHEGTEGK
jgi:hypothetical protein